MTTMTVILGMIKRKNKTLKVWIKVLHTMPYMCIVAIIRRKLSADEKRKIKRCADDKTILTICKLKGSRKKDLLRRT